MENDVVWKKKNEDVVLPFAAGSLSARFSSGGLGSLSLPFSSVPAQGTELCVPYKVLSLSSPLYLSLGSDCSACSGTYLLRNRLKQTHHTGRKPIIRYSLALSLCLLFVSDACDNGVWYECMML